MISCENFCLPFSKELVLHFFSFCRIPFAIRTWILAGDFREYKKCHVQWNKKWKPLMSTIQWPCNKVLRENFTTWTQDPETHWTKGIRREKTFFHLLKIKREGEDKEEWWEFSLPWCLLLDDVWLAWCSVDENQHRCQSLSATSQNSFHTPQLKTYDYPWNHHILFRVRW